MINFAARFIICLMCLLWVTACIHRVSNTPCAARCETRYQACNKVCRNNCPQCTAAAGQVRDKNYNHYLHEQYVKGRTIALQLNSFRDPLQCRKVTCSCREDYQVCIQSCGGDGGSIKKFLQHAPLCS